MLNISLKKSSMATACCAWVTWTQEGQENLQRKEYAHICWWVGVLGSGSDRPVKLCDPDGQPELGQLLHYGDDGLGVYRVLGLVRVVLSPVPCDPAPRCRG